MHCWFGVVVLLLDLRCRRESDFSRFFVCRLNSQQRFNAAPHLFLNSQLDFAGHRGG